MRLAALLCLLPAMALAQPIPAECRQGSPCKALKFSATKNTGSAVVLVGDAGVQFGDGTIQNTAGGGTNTSFTATAANGANAFIAQNEGALFCLNGVGCTSYISGDSTGHGVVVSSNASAAQEGIHLANENDITSGTILVADDAAGDGIQVNGHGTLTITNSGTSNALVVATAYRFVMGTSYIAERSSNNGLDFSSAGTDDNFILNAPASSNNILRVQKNGSDEFKVDNNGSGTFSNNVVAVASVRARSSNPVPSCHVGTGSCASQTEQGLDRGSVALSSGSATVSFPVAYSANPFCVCQDQANTASLITRCNASTTVLTITGTGTDTIAYICIGNY